MATDILDEHRFQKHCSLYESTRTPKENNFNPPSMSTVNQNRRIKYATQTNIPASRSGGAAAAAASSIHDRHSGSSDLLSFLRSFALKPFKTSSMTNTFVGGQTNHVLSDSQTHTAKSSVNLLKYRPLSDVLTDHASYTQSTYAIEEFFKRMGWIVNSISEEGPVHWNTAMKFLIPAKFDVNRAIELYRAHENLRKAENLDRIWIHNPRLVQEIESGQFFALPHLPSQPLTVIFTVSNLNKLLPNDVFTQPERELITLQALVCQLDVLTESLEVQQSGLNFVYDMQNSSSSQLDINLSKKILKLLQGGYPAMLKNIFIVSAPKWFRVVYKVTLFSPEQMRDYLTAQAGYASDAIPISLGGTLDPFSSGDIRYQMCRAKATNPQSICHPFYLLDNPSSTPKTLTNSARFFSVVPSTSAAMPSSPTSFLSFLSRRSTPQTPRQNSNRKRESPLTLDSEKRRRSNESLIDEEEEEEAEALFHHHTSSLLPKENLDK